MCARLQISGLRSLMLRGFGQAGCSARCQCSRPFVGNVARSNLNFGSDSAGKPTNALMVSAHAAGMPMQGGVSRQRDANDQNTGYPRLFVCSDRKSSPSVSGAVLP
jgi:hypothetical protein